MRIKAKYPHEPRIPKDDSVRIPIIGIAQQRTMATA
jgi:hypothetical protein